MAKDWKDRLGVVYSTNPDFNYDTDKQEQAETLLPSEQKLKVSIDRKMRKGKTVTLVEGFAGNEEDLKELALIAHWLKGAGGTFGFGAFTETAEELEKALEKAIEHPGPALVEVAIDSSLY